LKVTGRRTVLEDVPRVCLGKLSFDEVFGDLAPLGIGTAPPFVGESENFPEGAIDPNGPIFPHVVKDTAGDGFFLSWVIQGFNLASPRPFTQLILKILE
jgi:hypothetical protein